MPQVFIVHNETQLVPEGEVIPSRKKPETDAGYFELLAKAVFQAGFSYKVVSNKWEGITKVFHNFDTSKISRWKDVEILEAMESPDIIRNIRKITAIVDNASRFEELIAEHGSFLNFLKSFDKMDYDEKRNFLTSNFKWLGKTGAYFFLYCINDISIPPWDER